MITQTTLTKVLEFEIRLSNLNSRIQVIKLGVQVTPLAEELQVQVNYAMTCRLQIEKGRKEPRVKGSFCINFMLIWRAASGEGRV